MAKMSAMRDELLSEETNAVMEVLFESQEAHLGMTMHLLSNPDKLHSLPA